MKRRQFMKVSGCRGLTTLAGCSAVRAGRKDPTEFVGVLVDTTRCIGCRACEVACAEEHGHPVPDVENDEALAAVRQTTDSSGPSSTATRRRRESCSSRSSACTAGSRRAPRPV